MSLNASPKRRQGRQQLAPIAPGHQSAIENDDPAAIGFLADQPATGLYQFAGGIGQGDLQEGVAAPGTDPFGLGRLDGRGGNGERQLGDDEVG